MKLKLVLFFSLVITLLFGLVLFPRTVNAQFTGDFGSITGSVKWGTEPIGADVHIEENTTHFGVNTYGPSFNTGAMLPPGTYTVTATVKGLNGESVIFTIGGQTVTVIGGETATVNFDASPLSGLVKGGLNGGGYVQFCPLDGSPCIGAMERYGSAYYQVGGNFSYPLPPGDYRVHAINWYGYEMGNVPVTVAVGQITDDPNLQFSLNLNTITGSVKWGTENINSEVLVMGNTTGYGVRKSASPFNTGSILPPDTYTVTAYVLGLNGESTLFTIGSQTITVAGGETATVNFDASSVSGLVKGNVNGSWPGGYVQFCPSNGTTCIGGMDRYGGPYYQIGSQFSYPLPPGDYTVHVINIYGENVGEVPVTVTTGQITQIADIHVPFHGSITGSVKWGTEPIGADVHIEENTTHFGINTYGPSFNTGAIFPPGTYTVTATVKWLNGESVLFTIGSQTVTVAEGETATVNFDASPISGLVKGSLSGGGYVQFCPLSGTPCIGNMDRYGSQYFQVGGNFSYPLPPGDYRVHAINWYGYNLGEIQTSVHISELTDLIATSVNLPTGDNVTASLGNVTATFTSVIDSGFMSLIKTSNPQGGQPPSQYRFLGTYYELTTTATYTGPITVSFTYNDADVHGQESNLKLFHWDGSAWHNITTSVDVVNNIITGVTPTLSPFAIGDLLNSPPTASAGGPYDVDEGSSVTLSGAGTDPDGDVLTYAWDLDHNGTFETSGQNVNYSAADIDGPAVKTVDLQVCDDKSSCATSTATINIHNVAPTAGVITLDPSGPQIIDATVNTNTSFADPGKLDTHTATWNWGDGNSTNGVVTESNGSGSVTGSHTYTSAGVYTLTITVTDNNSAAATKEYKYIVIYDPSAGFVTGGGQVSSSLFGISAKYTPNSQTPVGNVGYTFSNGSMVLASTQIDWLVVDGNIAILTGSGTINGTGNYYFLVSVIDGSPDKLRIRISDTLGNLIYDNQPGDPETSAPTTSISAGQIKIH